MAELKKIIEINRKNTEERKRLNERANQLYNESKDICNTIDLSEVASLKYKQVKDVLKEIGSRLNDPIKADIEKIMQEKKEEEYPGVRGVRYYPELEECAFLDERQKIRVDRILAEYFTRIPEKPRKSNRYDIEFMINNNCNFSNGLKQFLVNKGILEKQYIFHCNCGGDDCYDKVITQERFDDLKEYWKKAEDGIETTQEEDELMNFGWFETGCWEGESVEIGNLKNFNDNLVRVKYVPVKKPDLTFDLI